MGQACTTARPTEPCGEEVVCPVCILLGFYRRQAALLFIFYVIFYVIATAVLFHAAASR